jgi:hypothetical protein
MEAIMDTSNTFDYVDVPIDNSFESHIARLRPTSDTISNARSYYVLHCGERTYQVVFDRSSVINLNGTNYGYDAAFVAKLANVIPARDRPRYLPRPKSVLPSSRKSSGPTVR